MVFYTLRKSAFKTKLHVLNYLGINYPCLQEKMPLMTSDTFSGFFYQAGLVSPAISWILQPGRFPTRTGLLYAITFLVVLASISIGLQLYEQESNFYEIIGVHRDSPLNEIKKAYRTRSIDLHPDKNPAPQAAEEFNRLRTAFEILGDADKRGLYDLYGEGAVLKDKSALMIETIIGLVSYYAVWTVFTYILTLNESSRKARSWAMCGEILMLILEVNLKFGGLQLPTSLMPSMTVFEFSQLLRSAYPTFMNGCRTIGVYFHRNIVQDNFMLGLELLKSNRAILLSIRELQGDIASSKRRPDAKVVRNENNIPPLIRSKRSKIEKPIFSGVYNKSIPEVNDELNNPTPEVQNPASLKIPGFVYAIGMCLAFSYFFK